MPPTPRAVCRRSFRSLTPWLLAAAFLLLTPQSAYCGGNGTAPSDGASIDDDPALKNRWGADPVCVAVLAGDRYECVRKPAPPLYWRILLGQKDLLSGMKKGVTITPESWNASHGQIYTPMYDFMAWNAATGLRSFETTKGELEQARQEAREAKDISQRNNIVDKAIKKSTPNIAKINEFMGNEYAAPLRKLQVELRQEQNKAGVEKGAQKSKTIQEQGSLTAAKHLKGMGKADIGSIDAAQRKTFDNSSGKYGKIPPTASQRLKAGGKVAGSNVLQNKTGAADKYSSAAAAPPPPKVPPPAQLAAVGGMVSAGAAKTVSGKILEEIAWAKYGKGAADLTYAEWNVLRQAGVAGAESVAGGAATGGAAAAEGAAAGAAGGLGLAATAGLALGVFGVAFGGTYYYRKHRATVEAEESEARGQQGLAQAKLDEQAAKSYVQFKKDNPYSTRADWLKNEKDNLTPEQRQSYLDKLSP